MASIQKQIQKLYECDFFAVPFEMKYPVKRNPTLKELEFNARMFKFNRSSCCDKDNKTTQRKGMNKERALSMSNIFAEKGSGCVFGKENKMKKEIDYITKKIQYNNVKPVCSLLKQEYKDIRKYRHKGSNTALNWNDKGVSCSVKEILEKSPTKRFVEKGDLMTRVYNIGNTFRTNNNNSSIRTRNTNTMNTMYDVNRNGRNNNSTYDNIFNNNNNNSINYKASYTFNKINMY